jgi:hypothetical protein
MESMDVAHSGCEHYNISRALEIRENYFARHIQLPEHNTSQNRQHKQNKIALLPRKS